MNDKQKAMEIVRSLPDDCSADDIICALYRHWMIEQGLKDAAAGRVIPHEEVRRLFDDG